MQPDIINSPGLVRVERRSAAAGVQTQLQSLIEHGHFKQHERLPSEIELARSFGVSRPVVREALMSLQALGLTAPQTGKGTFVISDRIRAPLLIGRYSPAHIKEVRRALEIPSAEFAAIAAHRSRCRPACGPARAHGRRGRSGASRNKLDADFTFAIAVASGNGLFVKLIEDMRTILEEHSLALAKAPHRRSAARVEHTKIYEAIVRRDMDAASAAMAEHLDAAEQSFALLGETLNSGERKSNPLRSNSPHRTRHRR